MKQEWRKQEKAIYLPKNKPERVQIPAFNFYVIDGAGNPNSEAFADVVAQLYALSYAIRMSPKKNRAPQGYQDYTVYPLEGIWDLNEKGRANYDGSFDKDDLVYRLMIRQPDFVTKDYALEVIEWLKKEKPNPLLEQVKFESIEDGDCIQMLHLGPYDDEPASFEQMEAFAEGQGLKRASKIHREIYLSDARKVEPAKLKTVLRFWLEA
tara:strand:+ start:443 stop:1069 length:627 start_codon:yes stop_codon:yes gene_type:complete